MYFCYSETCTCFHLLLLSRLSVTDMQDEVKELRKSNEALVRLMNKSPKEVQVQFKGNFCSERVIRVHICLGWMCPLIGIYSLFKLLFGVTNTATEFLHNILIKQYNTLCSMTKSILHVNT